MSEVWLDPGSHGVRFCGSGTSACDAIAEFFTAGTSPDDPLVLIARRATFETVSGLLASGRFGPRADAGRIHFVEAEETLAQIAGDGMLDAARAHAMFVQLLTEVRQRHAGGTIRLFGEMVDVLCERGRFDAAVVLEGVAGRLFELEPRLAILCGYSLARFREGAGAPHFHAICSSHTHWASSGVDDDPPAKGEPPGPREEGASPPAIVYVIDDDASLRRSLERLLSLSDFRVATFESAESLLAVVDHLPPGCLVVDIQLGGGLSGLDLLDRMRTLRPAWPAIAMSGSHNENAEKESLRLGARVFLRKPFDPQSLLDAITRTFA